MSSRLNNEKRVEPSPDVAIRAVDLGKCYRVYPTPRARVKQLVFGSERRRYFRDVWALKGLSFEIRRGEIVGVIGRNGSGKSTLLQLVCGTLTPTEGRVEVNGRISALLELGAGFNPEFSGRENVFLNGAVLGLSQAEVRRRLPAIEEFADIGDFLDAPVKTYSSGMFVRLAFAVQVCVDPEILVVDEALAVGDIFFRQKCYRRLAELRQGGCTILLVTHGMGDVEQYCNRGIVLSRGEAIFDGLASDAVKRYYLLDTKTAGHEIAEPSISQPGTHCVESEYQSGDCFSKDALKIHPSSSILTSGGLKFCGIAIRDSDGQARQSFEQGEYAHFFCEIALEENIEVPVAGISLQNDRGVIVHGKSSLEHDAAAPRVGVGARLRFHQSIKLDIAAGEYTVEIGIGDIAERIYEVRHSVAYDELSSHLRWLCAVSHAATISVSPRQVGHGVQLMFHGVADLPGECRMWSAT